MLKSPFLIPLISFIHGVMLVIIVTLWSMASYENQLYDNIVAKLTGDNMSQQEIAISLLNGTHSLLKPRQDFFRDSNYSSFREKLFRSADMQLIDAKGSCGSYSHVLGRLLQRAGFEVRIAQMKCGQTWGCHILLEANVDGRFVSLDALYNLSFTRLDGKLASFNEVGEGWVEYKEQVPESYNSWFAYEDVRYTNWDKIPVLMPAIRAVLYFFIGENVNTLSIRANVLNVYQVYLFLFFIAYLSLLVLSGYVWIRIKKN